MAAERDLFFDWNAANAAPDRLAEAVVLDETLRDGIQSPSAVDPRIEEKIEILHLLDELGVAQLDVGLPGAGPHQRDAVKRLVEEIRDARLRIRANVACRTVIADIAPAAEVQQETGVPLEVYAFIGSSPIRQYAEEWDLAFIEKQSVEAIRFAEAARLRRWNRRTGGQHRHRSAAGESEAPWASALRGTRHDQAGAFRRAGRARHRPCAPGELSRRRRRRLPHRHGRPRRRHH